MTGERNPARGLIQGWLLMDRQRARIVWMEYSCDTVLCGT